MARSPALPPSAVWVPWLFSIFLLSNLLLSYFPLAPFARMAVGLLGLALPLGLAFWKAPRKSAESFQKEFLPEIPAWLLLLLGALAVGERFYRLTTLSAWPFYDDSLWGWLALKFNRGGVGLFPVGANFPSTYAWGLALLFKWLKPSLFTLWLYPALISALTVGAGYGAARLFFSRSLSFLAGLMLAFGFWPLYVGRIGDQMGLVLLAECAFAALWGWFLKAKDLPSRAKRAFALGAAAAAGFYIFISWATVAALGALAVLVEALRRKPRSWKPLAFFGLGFLVLLPPLLYGGLGDSIRSYASGIGLGPQDWDFGRQWEVSLSYLTVLFWGMDPTAYTYQPAWGGFLDPLLDAFFFLGWWELGRRGKGPFLAGTGAFLFFLLPGMATFSREPLRVLPVLPLMIVFCSLGWRSLLASGAPRLRVLLLIVPALAFAGLDFYHLAVRYHRLWDSPGAWSGYGKSIERYRAHFLLDQIARDQGPGLIFGDFLPGLCDQSLFVVEDAHNAAQNPSLSFQDARWAAVLANVNYKPFLQKRFAQGRAFALSEGLDRPDGGWMLWLAPVTPANRPDFQKWKEAGMAFECWPYDEVGERMKDPPATALALGNDPFLHSCYWEKLSDLSYRDSGLKDKEAALKDLAQAVQRGYPAAHLYWRMGTFYLMEGDRARARRCFEKARSAPLDLTTSRGLLSGLETAGGRKTP